MQFETRGFLEKSLKSASQQFSDLDVPYITFHKSYVKPAPNRALFPVASVLETVHSVSLDKGTFAL